MNTFEIMDSNYPTGEVYATMDQAETQAASIRSESPLAYIWILTKKTT